MSIQSAWIEAAYPNAQDSGGWVLAVQGQWGASTFGSFDLTPNDTPKLVVAVTNRAGYARSGGEAVATTVSLNIPVTAPLRKPWPDSTQAVPVLDETDNGGGVRTVRFALAEPVYPGDTLTLNALSGWRTGLPAQSGISVTNNSARARLKPWGRWAIPQDEIVDGTSFTVEMVTVSHTPRHDGASLHQPVAGVRFIASDGTNTASAWALATTESTRFDDSLWCHRAELNLAGLNSGRVTIHAEVYPWQGEVWTTRDGYWDAEHITQDFKATGRGWQVMLDPRPETPLCITLDKDGTFLPRRHVVLAPDGQGTTTPDEAACVRATYAEAADVPAADRPSTIGAALDALGRVTRTVAASNGFAALTNIRFPGGLHVWCPAGTRDLGVFFGSFYSPNTVAYGEARVLPVPGVARADIVFNKSTTLTYRMTRLAIQGVTLNSTSSTAYFGGGGNLPYLRLDDVAIQGTAANGRSSNPTQVFGDTTTGSLDSAYVFTRCSITNMNLSQGCTGLARNSKVEQTTTAWRPLAVFNCWRDVSVALPTFDVRWDGCIFVNCRWEKIAAGTGSFFALHIGQPTSPTAPATRSRVAFINCLWERIGATTNPGAQIGETAYNQVNNIIWDGCTTVGARFNFHNDPAQAESNYIYENSRIGCIFDRNATKHDTFSERALHTGGWEITYGVRQRDTFSADRFQGVITANFPHDFVGLNVVKGALTPGVTINLKYELDKSGESHLADKSGGGDYRLTDESFAWRLRTLPANYPADLDGALRGTVMHAGAWGVAPADAPEELAPDNAAHAHTAEEGGLDVFADDLAPAAAIHAHTATQGGLQIGAVDLAPAAAVHSHTASQGGLQLGAVQIVPAAAIHAHIAGQGLVYSPSEQARVPLRTLIVRSG